MARAAMNGETNLFIHPGFRFRCAGAMLTNFHLPQSSLLMLVTVYEAQWFVSQHIAALRRPERF